MDLPVSKAKTNRLPDKSSRKPTQGEARPVGKWTALGKELNPFVWIYFFFSLLELRTKLWITTTWFDGTLEQNHQALLAFDYTNNEQSRLLQFYLPECLVHVFGITVSHAYIAQRWFFVGLAYVLFHLYLRRWFSKGLSFATVCLLSALLPFTFVNDLQESSSFLMASFVVG